MLQIRVKSAINKKLYCYLPNKCIRNNKRRLNLKIQAHYVSTSLNELIGHSLYLQIIKNVIVLTIWCMCMFKVQLLQTIKNLFHPHIVESVKNLRIFLFTYSNTSNRSILSSAI